MSKKQREQVGLGHWHHELVGEGNALLRTHIDNIAAFIDEGTAEADRRIRARRYGNILVEKYMLDGFSNYTAQEKMRTERSKDPHAFSERADGFFAYREYITSGESALPIAIFNYSIVVQPGVVLENAAQWYALHGQIASSEVQVS